MGGGSLERSVRSPGRHARAAEDTDAFRLEDRAGDLVAFLRRHWLITVILVLAAIVRVIVMLAYPPGFWFPDSLPYIASAVHPVPYQVRPVGYSFLLMLLEPSHSVFFVVAVQHAMGLVIGAEVYILLQRHKLPAWGSALAAAPALLSAPGLQIEHFVLSDTLFVILVTTALLLLLWRPVPRVWTCCVVGLLLGWAVVDRSQGMLLLLPFLAYLAIARLGLRRFIVAAIAMTAVCALPVVAYALWFDQNYGEFQLTTSTGPFLYSRVAPFAECSTIKPPRDERWLCVSAPLSKRESPAWYLWYYKSPLYRGPGQPFANAPNSLETNFALRAIEAQPADYVQAVWSATVEAFLPLRDTNYSANTYLFPAKRPVSLRMFAKDVYGNYADTLIYNGGSDASTQMIQPYAGWLRAYQRFVFIPGPLLGVIVAVGFVGVVIAWRRCGGPSLLPWLSGLVLIVTPAATADFDARYVVAAVPAFCIAAGLSIKEVQYAWRVRGLRLQTAGQKHGVGSSHRASSDPD